MAGNPTTASSLCRDCEHAKNRARLRQLRIHSRAGQPASLRNTRRAARPSPGTLAHPQPVRGVQSVAGLAGARRFVPVARNFCLTPYRYGRCRGPIAKVVSDAAEKSSRLLGWYSNYPTEWSRMTRDILLRGLRGNLAVIHKSIPGPMEIGIINHETRPQGRRFAFRLGANLARAMKQGQQVQEKH